MAGDRVPSFRPRPFGNAQVVWLERRKGERRGDGNLKDTIFRRAGGGGRLNLFADLLHFVVQFVFEKLAGGRKSLPA